MYWPNREEAMNCEAFTVTLIRKDRLCLSNEEQISIHDLILEATQVYVYGLSKGIRDVPGEG